MSLKTLFGIVTFCAIYIPCLGFVTNGFAGRHGTPMEGVERFMVGISNLPEYPLAGSSVLLGLAIMAAVLDGLVWAFVLIAYNVVVDELRLCKRRARLDALNEKLNEGESK